MKPEAIAVQLKTYVWHRLLTDEASGYYQDYGPDPRRHLARVLASGFQKFCLLRRRKRSKS